MNTLPSRPFSALLRSLSVLLPPLLIAQAACNSPPSMHAVRDPTIESFVPGQSPLLEGTSTTLIALFKDGVGEVDQGIGEVKSGMPVTVSPTETTTYTLTVIGRTMATITAQATIEVVKNPDAPIITAPAYVTANLSGYGARIVEQEGCTYAWSIEGGSFDGAADGVSVLFTPGASGVVKLHCTVTNRLGTGMSSTANALIVAAPVSPLFALAERLSRGHVYSASVTSPVEGSSYAWSISGGELGSGAGAQSTFTPTGEPESKLTLTCVETNRAGTVGPPATGEALIVAAPIPFAIDAPNEVTAGYEGYGASVDFQPDCTYAWIIQNGTIEGEADSTAIHFTPGSSGEVLLTCTVTNSVGDSSAEATKSIPITAAPLVPQLSAPAVVTDGRSHEARVLNVVTRSTYEWRLVGATTATATGSTITFTPALGVESQVTFTCIEVNSAGMTGDPGNAVSEIVPPPVQPALSAPLYVSAGESYGAAVQNPVATSTYAWTIQGGELVTSTGTSVQFVPSGSAGAQVKLSCVETNQAGVAGTPGGALSTLQGAPGTPTLTAPQYLTAGESATAQVTSPAPTSTYRWEIEGGTLTTWSGANIRFVAGLSGAVTLSCVETNRAGTPGAPGSAQTNIVAPPMVPVIDRPQYITAGTQGSASVAASVASSTYGWTLSGATPTSATGTQVNFTAGLVGAINYSVVETNQAGRAGAPGGGNTVIVAAPQVPQLTAPTHVTSGNSYSARVTAPVAGSSYAWGIQGGELQSSSGTAVTFTVTGTAGGEVTLSCIETNRAGTAGAKGEATAAIIALPGLLTIQVPAHVSTSGTGMASVVGPVAGSTYKWSIVGGLLLSATGTSVTFNPQGIAGAVVTLTARETTQAGTEGLPATGSSIVVAAPNPPLIAAPANVSPGGSYGASVQNLVGTSTYAWSITGGSISPPATGPSVTFTPTVAAGGQVKLSCIETNSAGDASAPGTKDVNVVAAAGEPLLTAPRYVTAGESFGASVQSPGSGTYDWVLTGATPSTATGPSISFTPTGAPGSKVTLSCKETVASVQGPAGVVESEIVAPPAMPTIVAPLYVTQGQTIGVTLANGVAKSRYAWSAVNGAPAALTPEEGPSFAVKITGAPGAFAQYQAIETNAAGKAGAVGSAQSEIVAAPVMPVLQVPALVTSGQQASAQVISPVANSTYQWSITGGTLQTSTGTSVTFTPTGNGGSSVMLSCVETNRAGVAGAPGVGYAAIVAPPATLALSAPQYVGPGASVIASVQGANNSSTYQWSITGATPTSASGPTIPVTAGASGVITFKCTETNQAGQSGAEATAQSTIVQPPVAPTLSAPKWVTVGDALNATVTAPVAGSTYTWTVAGETTKSVVGTEATAATNQPGAVTFTCVEKNLAGATGPASMAVTTVLPKPEKPVIAAPQYVGQGSAGNAASVVAQANCTYVWTITGGEIAGPSNGPAITFSAGESGSVLLGCTVTNAAGASEEGAKSVSIIGPPQAVIDGPGFITRDSEGIASVAAQEGATYLWSVEGGVAKGATNGTSLRFGAGAGELLTLKVRVTNALGVAANGVRSVTIFNAPTTSFDYAMNSVPVTTGLFSSCAMIPQGGVRCWGGGYGTGRSIAGLSEGVLSLASGVYHACALDGDGAIKCWTPGAPVAVPKNTYTSERYVQVSAGMDYDCALTSTGRVFCWGPGAYSSLTSSPNSADPFAEITVGHDRDVCARTPSGKVYCWYGSGLPSLRAERALAMVNSGHFFCYIQDDFVVKCQGWGGGTSMIPGARSIVNGHGHVCVLQDTGEVYCWGNNTMGQLGIGTCGGSVGTPQKVLGLADVVAIESGCNHTCAVTGSGVTKCWGDNDANQLAGGVIGPNGAYAPRTMPMVAFSAEREVALGGGHTCALTPFGGVRCWGKNGDGQLGDGTENQSLAPTAVEWLERGVVGLAAGGSHTCALNGAGAIWCWGSNAQGQLGVGSSVSSTKSPLGISIVAKGLSVGRDFTCALQSSGCVRCWGAGASGQLGNGATQNTSVPVDVSGLSSVESIAAGAQHACAVMNGGSVNCWGNNSAGQLGDGTQTNRSLPAPVSLSGAAKAVGAGEAHTCVLLMSGAVHCWGANGDGQLGDGGSSPSLAPKVVSGLSAGVKAIAVGGHHACALLADGAVKCWGKNANGQVGDGSSASKNAPVEVLAPSAKVASLVAGPANSCAVNESGLILCWGANADGVLGDGGTTDRLSPVAIRERQFIFFPQPPPLSPGQSHTLQAESTSGLLVTYEVTTPSICSVSGSQLTIAPTAPANSKCEVRALQPGAAPASAAGGSYVAASPAVRQVTVAP